MDIIRRPYTTQCNFGVGGTLPAKIRWYVVPPGTPALGFPSVIRDLDWEDVELRYGDVGEVWGSPRRFDGRDPPDVAGIDHICGTEADFRRGALHPADPPRKYAADGLPECCRPIPDAMALSAPPVRVIKGSVVLGGAAEIVHVGPHVYGCTPGEGAALLFDGDPAEPTWSHRLGPTVLATLYGPGVYPGSAPTEWVLVEFAGPTEWRNSSWDGVSPAEFDLVSGSGCDPIYLDTGAPPPP